MTFLSIDAALVFALTSIVTIVARGRRCHRTRPLCPRAGYGEGVAARHSYSIALIALMVTGVSLIVKGGHDLAA